MAKNPIKINLWLPALALIALYFINNWAIPLWNADEAAYAGIADQMRRSGNWLTQEFFWSEIHRKPPLHLWLTALSMSLFGANEWATRFFSSVFMLTSLYLVYRWVSSYFNKEIGLLSALVMGSNLLLLALGKIGFTDSTLLLCQIVCGFALLGVSQNPKSNLHLWLFWLGLALGMLTKGPQILIPFGVLILAMTFFKMDRQIIVKLKPWFFLPLSILPLLIWGWISWEQDDGEFVMWLIDWYVLRRAGGSVLGQSGPPGYYLLVLSGSFFLYFAGFFGVLRKVVKRAFRVQTVEGFLIFWALSAWIPFELIPSKLPHYVSGAIPPLAILTAISLMTINEQVWKKIWLRIAIFVQVTIAAVVASLLVYLIQEQFGFRGLLIVILTGLVPLIAVIIFVIQVELKKFSRAPFVLATGGVLFGLMIFLPLMNVLSPVFSCPKEIGRTVGYEINSDDIILLAKKDHHMISLPFYLRQEGEVQEAWNVEGVLNDIKDPSIGAVITDSITAQALLSDFELEGIYQCFDINETTYRNYHLLIRK